MWLTAGLFNAFVDICPRLFSGLDQLIVGGEPLSPGHVRRVDQLLPPGARIVNGYGPTEGTTFTCCYNIPRPVSAELRSIPIGRPIAHTNVYVVDDHLRPVSLGSSGELCIGGDGLAVGYLNAPQLTAEKFVSNLYSPTEGERIYRTGDLARWGDDGNLEFLGRTDQQIKVRGHRVEPAEIEWALQEHKDIVRCLVGLREQHAGEKVLVAYFVAKGSPVPAATDLRSHLRTLLPEYMLPTAFIQVPHLPLNANGKLDRNCLASLPWHEQRNESNRLEFCSAEERVMAEMWADILGTTCVGRNDHFVFDLAGNSLLALQLIDRVNRRFGARLKVPDILSTPTVATMCAKVVACAKPSNEVVRYLDVVRPGARPVAVVCVGFANALPLLRETLADGVPIWWLKLDGLHAPPYSIRPIPEIAASYASELSQVAASELVLVGHSYCGLIVLELARHLRTSGRRVKALLLEPPLPQAFQRQVAARDECRRNRWHYSWKPVVDRRQTMTHRAKAVQHCDRFKLPTSQDFRAAMQWTAMRLQRRYRKSLLRPLLQVYVRLGCDLPLRYRQWWYYYPELKRRIRSFTINRASGPVVLAGQPSYLDNYLASWQCLLDGQVETCCLPAATRHTDLMKQPAAAEWLALVSRWAGS
jgi:thioesterase domain-containing protein